jgi:TonB-linked SusC/RagA family outer membrane protein
VVKRTSLLSLALLTTLGVAVAWGQQRQITGRVTTVVSAEPVAGANVSVVGTPIAAQTGDDGRFSLAAPGGEVRLVVRRIGYRRREVPVRADQSDVQVALEQDVFNLEAVVVTGLATGVERRNVGSAVATVSASELGFVPTPSLEQQLQGKVAGADIQQNGGAPGGGVQVRLRGVTSINATAEPLWVVDGVIVSDVAIPSNQNAVTAAAGGSNPSLNQDAQVNRIADLNPNDIESIEILRGASASAIYGQKASNGVVVIKTKRGRSGPPQFNFTQRLGFFQLSNKVGSRVFRDSFEVRATYKDTVGALTKYFRSDASNPLFGLPGYVPGQAFDLEEQLAGRRPLSFESAASISGGTDNTQYFASGAVKDDGGIIDNTGFQRQALRVNLDQRLGSRVRASFNTNYIHTLAQRGLSNNDNAGASFYVVLSSTPTFIDLGRQPGDTFARNPVVPSNPVQTAALMKNNEDVYRFIGGLNLQWDAVQTARHYLRFVTLGGADFFSQENALFFPPELQFEPNDGLLGTSLLSNSENLNLNLNASAVHTYTPSSNAFSATTSLGIQYGRRKLDISRITSRNLTAGQENVDAGTNIQINELRSKIRDLGFFTQEEFLASDQRLLLTAGIRADQSSLNADASKLYYFPKASASYRFLNPASFVDELKIRGAYGESGNQPAYAQKFTSLRPTNKIGGLPGTVLGDTTGAPDLRPEREREFEVGLDATLWGGRGSVELTGFQKSVSDLLLPRQLAPTNGVNFVVANGGKLRTRGVEVGVGVIPVQQSALSWVFRTTFSLNRSTITDLAGLPSFRAGGFGASLNQFLVEEGASSTQIVGNDTLTAADTASTKYDFLGAADTTGHVVVRKLGDANPDFKMSFNNDVTWKHFNLHVLLDWQQGGNIINLTKLLYDFGQVTADYAVPLRDTLIFVGTTRSDTLRTVGQKRIFGFGKTAGNFVESATFVKLREITLSYELPASAMRSFWRGARYVRLSVSGRNLFTITPFDGLDPEVSNFGNQAIARNVDVTPFPPSRSFWFAIDLGF